MDIFGDLARIFARGVNIVALAPKLSVAILVFNITPPFANHQAAFPFQKTDKAGYAHFQRDFNQHMHVIRADFRFDDRDALSTAQLPEYFPDFISALAVKSFATVFRGKHQVVFAVPRRV